MDKSGIFILLIVVFALILLFYIMLVIKRKKDERKILNAEEEAKKILEAAKKEAENIIKIEEVKAKENALRIKEELDEEIKVRRQEISYQEKRLIQKEEHFDRKEEKIIQDEKRIVEEYNELENKKQQIENLKQEQEQTLQRIANLTTEEAKCELLNKLENELVSEKAKIIKQYEEEIKDEQKKIAQEIISSAIQNCAADHTSISTISVVTIPSDEMKGRIIGREGRNIKTLEMLTGVQLIVDDTPEAILISGFDPVRRELAKMTLEKLMEDGRIHPARIEEVVDKCIEELSNKIKEAGERACLETGIHNLPNELKKILGKLIFRTSYGQNVLSHTIEVANLARNIAKQLGVDENLAARAGLLHDIGKALDHEVNAEGTHITLGVELLKKYKENDKVINAVEAHHGDVEPQTVEAVIVKAADAISASRPGARRDSFEAYIKRLEKLEEIASKCEGVHKSYALQAGREIRLIVDPEKISDDEMTVLAREVAQSIENELAFPGEIKVTVIREKRALDTAKQSKVNRTNLKETYNNENETEVIVIKDI